MVVNGWWNGYLSPLGTAGKRASWRELSLAMRVDCKRCRFTRHIVGTTRRGLSERLHDSWLKTGCSRRGDGPIWVVSLGDVG